MPYTGPLPDTLLVDGTDIQLLDGLVVSDFSGLYNPGVRRGDDSTIPRRQGQVGAELVRDAYTFTVPVTLLAENDGGAIPLTAHERRALFNTNLAAIATVLAGTGGLVALTRRLATTGGGYATHTAAGRFVSGTMFSLLNAETGSTELTFINLDGAWSPDAGVTWLDY